MKEVEDERARGDISKLGADRRRWKELTAPRPWHHQATVCVTETNGERALQGALIVEEENLITLQKAFRHQEIRVEETMWNGFTWNIDIERLFRTDNIAMTDDQVN